MSRHRYVTSSPHVVLVSVDKLDEAWRSNEHSRDLYVPPGGEGAGEPGEYAIARREVAAGNWTPPRVSLVGDSHVSFDGGRYRFAAARDLGRRSVLVAADPDQAILIREKFGV